MSDKMKGVIVTITALKNAIDHLRKNNVAKISLDHLDNILDTMAQDLYIVEPKESLKRDRNLAGCILTALILGLGFGAAITALCYEIF